MSVVLVGGSRKAKGLAEVIEAYETIVRIKTGNKLPTEDVGRKTDYLAMLHYRHWAQRKVSVREGWLWQRGPAGPHIGDGVRLIPLDALKRWGERMADVGIVSPSLGLCALVMTVEFLNPDVVVCAACDAFFDDVALPGHNAAAERKFISRLKVRRL